MPSNSYMVVTLSAGQNDDDLSDGCGQYYAGATSTPFLNIARDGVGLYTATPAASKMRDYMAWSGVGNAVSGQAATDAATAGIWPAGTFLNTLPVTTVDEKLTKVIPVIGDETSIGR